MELFHTDIVKWQSERKEVEMKLTLTERSIRSLAEGLKESEEIMGVTDSSFFSPEIAKLEEELDTLEKEFNQALAIYKHKHPKVLAIPPPLTHFMGFGDSSIDFELRVSINQPEELLIIRSDLYYMLWKALKENGIEIPFPQRDLNLGDGWDLLNPGLQAAG